MGRRSAESWPDSERLDLFVARAVEMFDEPAVVDFQLNVGFTFAAKQGQPITTEFRQPPEALLRSYLLAFRSFVSNDDPLHVNSIHNLLYKNISGDEMKGKMTARRADWLNNRKVGAMHLDLGGRVIEPAKALDLWINGHYFHNDHGKAAELRRLTGIDGELVRHAALDLVVEGSRYVQFLGWVITFGRAQGLLSV